MPYHEAGRRMYRSYRSVALVTLGTVMRLSVLCMHAQVVAPGINYSLPRVEASITFSPIRSNAGPGQCGCFYLNGGAAEAILHEFRGLSAVADVTVAHTDQINNTGERLSFLLATAGPRISYRIGGERFRRYTPFVQGLLGAAYGFDSTFPGKAGLVESSATSLALLAGGGVDVKFERHLSFRAIQVDYGRTRLPNNAGNQEKLLRVSTGIIFRLP
jgi:outer membrane immunogenic protein